MNLADALLPRCYVDGEIIIKQGVAADGMYFLEEGAVQITIMGDKGLEIEVIHKFVTTFSETVPNVQC